MNREAWFGLVVLVMYLTLGYLRIRWNRRSGLTHSFGHPKWDALLLFFSGILLASTLLFVSFQGHGQFSRLFVYPFLLGLGGVLTWACAKFLRRRRKARRSD